MKKCIILSTLLLVTLLCGGAAAMEGMDHGNKGGGHEMGPFKHVEKVDGIVAEFQVMSLASMNMKDEAGATHHVMAGFKDEASGEKITDAIGRVKIVRPTGEEEVIDLKDYSGILAANFKAEEKGKYGIICLFMINGDKHVAKFWWEHH